MFLPFAFSFVFVFALTERLNYGFEVVLEEADCGNSSSTCLNAPIRVFERHSPQGEHRHGCRLAAADTAQRFQADAGLIAFGKDRPEYCELGAFGFGEQNLVFIVARDGNCCVRNTAAIEDGAGISGRDFA